MTAKIGELHSCMSRPELAGYALSGTLGYAPGNISSNGSGNPGGSPDLPHSVYNGHIRELNTDKHADYLEQLLVEVEHGLSGSSLNSFPAPEGSVRAVTTDKCCTYQDEEPATALEGLHVCFSEGLTRPEYAEERSVTSGLTKGYREGAGNERQACMGL